MRIPPEDTILMAPFGILILGLENEDTGFWRILTIA
jgi:hypothetical protein